MQNQGAGFNYSQLLQACLAEEAVASPRQQATWEMGALSVMIPTGLTVHRKGFNPALGIVEGLNILAGHTDREAIARVAPKTYASGYFDNSNVEYGERIGQYLPRIIQELQEEPVTRRAIIQAGTILDEPHEKPCATTFQARVTDNGAVLRLYITMRSWDLLRGLPYNFMMWGIVGLAMQHTLGVSEGILHFYASTPHIYQDDAALLVDAKEGPQMYLDTPYAVPFDYHQTLAKVDLREAPWEQAPPSSWFRKPDWIQI